MLIAPHILGKEYGYSTHDTEWVSEWWSPTCKIPGKQYGYPTYDPRWEVWLSCLRSQVKSIVIPSKIPGEEYGYPT